MVLVLSLSPSIARALAFSLSLTPYSTYLLQYIVTLIWKISLAIAVGVLIPFGVRAHHVPILSTCVPSEFSQSLTAGLCLLNLLLSFLFIASATSERVRLSQRLHG